MTRGPLTKFKLLHKAMLVELQQHGCSVLVDHRRQSFNPQTWVMYLPVATTSMSTVPLIGSPHFPRVSPVVLAKYHPVALILGSGFSSYLDDGDWIRTEEGQVGERYAATRGALLGADNDLKLGLAFRLKGGVLQFYGDNHGA